MGMAYSIHERTDAEVSEGIAYFLQGFVWKNEGRPGQSAKWGFVAHSPNDNLELDVGLEGVQAIGNELTIGLGFLVRWNGRNHIMDQNSNILRITGKVNVSAHNLASKVLSWSLYSLLNLWYIDQGTVRKSPKRLAVF